MIKFQCDSFEKAIILEQLEKESIAFRAVYNEHI